MSQSTTRQLIEPHLEFILPEAPQHVSGSQIIAELKRRSNCKHLEDGTIRYNLSQMVKDPSSPIAKVSAGAGYYLRPKERRVDRETNVTAMEQGYDLAISFARWFKNPNNLNHAEWILEGNRLREEVGALTDLDLDE